MILVAARVCVSQDLQFQPLAAPIALSDDRFGIDELLATHCARCHAVPSPDIAPKRRWPFMLSQMHQHLEQINQPLDPSSMQRLLTYFQRHAPEELPPLPVLDVRSKLRFKWKFQFDTEPGVVHVQAVDLDQDGMGDVLISDANRNAVTWLRHGTEGWRETSLVEGIESPARTRVFDWQQDGDLDVVVAGLGQVLPTDELKGYVTLLVNDGTQQFQRQNLLSGVPRVADVAVADLDLDGDVDFALAMFGWIRTGAVGWLEQVGPEQFRWHNLASLSGTMNVAVTDLNRDNRPDFVALVSQAQEQVLAFVNQGPGSFAVRTLHDAKNPMFGFSGMKLVDLDGDSDDDILLTNGDVFDARPELRPHNGIHWLENQGNLQFTYHFLSALYGAFSPVAGDLDGDGDLDVVATSFFNDWTDRRRQSLVWLENNGQQQFTIRPLSNSPTDLPTADVGDFNGDGWLDIVAGGLIAGRPASLYGPPRRRARWAVWTNLGRGLGKQEVVRQP